MDSLEELIALFKHCTAHISIPGESGTGFFVAPGLLLTCAHVVGNVQSNEVSVTVQWEGETYTAKILRLLPEPYPDLALLKLEHGPLTHPCIFLHGAVRTDDKLSSYGYPIPLYNRDQRLYNRDPATFVFEGLTGDSPLLMKFKFGEARPGFSGAPLLNQRTGGVCGVMALTRGAGTLMGGRAIPTSVVLEQFEELVTLQKEFHDKDHHWYDLLPESEVKPFSWQELRATCSKITEKRMATVQDEYHKELYLQRDRVHQIFMRFLEDPTKQGFVLIGGSGVGKSSFLLAAQEELQSQEGVCVLIYDAASLMERPLMEILDEHFHQWGPQRVEWKTRQLWEKINNIDGIDKRHVLFCIDALNEQEQEQAKSLLKQLNELIMSPWSWLKVVIVSRPEAWQFIKRGVKLANSLYYRGDGGTPGESFNYSELLEPFSRQELPLVYEKYRQINQVQTSYDELSSRVRDIIRDPFNLKLVTQVYEVIPEDLKVTTLIGKCVEALAKRGKLQGGDTRWLEKQLVPLMVSEEHYENVITDKELYTADQALHEAVLDRAERSGLSQIQRFINLADAGILEQKSHRDGFTISFKSERYYDYFIGRRLFHMSKDQVDRYTYFLDMVGRTTERPYLWGAVKNALIEEAEKHDSEIVLKLCFTGQQHVREMMISTLTTLGQDDLQWVEDLLDKLLPIYKQPSEWRKGQQLLGKATSSLVASSRNAGRIAIEVASSLNLPRILLRGSLHPDPTLRTLAVRCSYDLWQRDQDGGFELLERLTEYATGGFLPDVNALESVLGFSVVIFFEHYQDRLIAARLQRIWREVIGKLLRIRGEGGRSGEVMRAFIRERLFSFSLTLISRILDSFPGYTIVSYKKLNEFFHLGSDEKVIYRNLVRYIDVDAEFSQEQMERDYLAAIRINDLFFVIAFDLSVVPHACRDPLATLPLLRKLFAAAKSNVVTYPYLSEIANALENILNSGPIREEVFDFFVEAVETSQEIYTDYPQCIRNRHSIAPKATFLGAYILHQYRRTGTLRNDEWLKTRIKDALAGQDLPFFDLLLTVELPFAGIEWRKPQAALETLAMFFQRSLNAPLEKDDKSILQFISAFLARLRIRYPDEVDDFLAQQVDDFLAQSDVTSKQQQVAEAFRLQVQTSETVETVGELIGEKAVYFLRDEVILHSPGLRSQIMQVFDKAADYTKLEDWLDYFIRQIVNQIYGGEALRQATK